MLVAQDLASYGRDQGVGTKDIVPLVEAVASRVAWVRLLYLYPSELTDRLVEAILATGVPYFDLSLQHVSRPLLRRMRRWGDGQRFLDRIDGIRARGTRRRLPFELHRRVPRRDRVGPRRAPRRSWTPPSSTGAGSSPTRRKTAPTPPGSTAPSPRSLADERLAELRERQDAITAARRDELVGSVVEVLVDEPGVARSHREAPEIDGIITVPLELAPGSMHRVRITGAEGPDSFAEPLLLATR